MSTEVNWIQILASGMTCHLFLISFENTFNNLWQNGIYWCWALDVSFNCFYSWSRSRVAAVKTKLEYSLEKCGCKSVVVLSLKWDISWISWVRMCIKINQCDSCLPQKCVNVRKIILLLFSNFVSLFGFVYLFCNYKLWGVCPFRISESVSMIIMHWRLAHDVSI